VSLSSKIHNIAEYCLYGLKETAMRAMFSLTNSLKNWVGTFRCQFQLGFITASEIAYADWPESARNPERQQNERWRA
jgi:hypothetical protein